VGATDNATVFWELEGERIHPGGGERAQKLRVVGSDRASLDNILKQDGVVSTRGWGMCGRVCGKGWVALLEGQLEVKARAPPPSRSYWCLPKPGMLQGLSLCRVQLRQVTSQK
jgi:hypothetical protein